MTTNMKRITRELPVPMSDECVAVRAQELAALVNEKTAIETDLAAYGADKRKRLRTIRKDEKRLATAVASATELAMIDCIEERNFAQNEIKVIRQDPGKVVEPRPMKGDERQTEIETAEADDESVELEEDGTDEDPANSVEH